MITAVTVNLTCDTSSSLLTFAAVASKAKMFLITFKKWNMEAYFSGYRCFLGRL